LRSVRAVPERCPQHLPNDAAGHGHLDTIQRLAGNRHGDLPVLRTPEQRGTVEPSAGPAEGYGLPVRLKKQRERL